MRLCSSLVVIATSLLVAACGGSSPSSTGPGIATATATATATPAAASAQTTASATSTQATASGGATTTTSSVSAPPEVRKAKQRGHHRPSPAASQGAHVETSVTLSSAGELSPPVVSVPSGVGVAIHVTNHGSAAATVALAVPAHPSAHIAPGASATLQTGGLKDGTYRILVNGTPRGQLMIGAQGGP